MKPRSEARQVIKEESARWDVRVIEPIWLNSVLSVSRWKAISQIVKEVAEIR
jgi:hypothetical protein